VQENLVSVDVLEDFSNSQRWQIVPALVWIATRDMAIAANASLKNGYSPSGLAVRKAMQAQKGLAPNWPYDDLEKAWEKELAPAMADGKISAFATSVSFSKLGGFSQNITGVVYPPSNTPGAPLEHRLEDNNGIAAIVPNGKVFAHTWTEWHNATFPREKILELWKSPEAKKHKESDQTRLAKMNESSDWNIGEILVWIGDKTEPCFEILTGNTHAEMMYPKENLELRKRLMAAKKELWAKLAEGALTCTGIDPRTQMRMPIAAHDWQDMDLRQDKVVEGSLAHHNQSNIWTGVSGRKEDVQIVWPIAVVNVEGASKIADLPDVTTVSLPTLPESEIERQYIERRDHWPVHIRYPSREDDIKWAKSISCEVTNKMVRGIRAKFAPATWTAQGKRKSAK
jgi:hypothetical protein